MSKVTSYETVKNILIVASFNQPVDVNGVQKYQTVIEVRADTLITEGAVRGVIAKTTVGTATDIPRTNKQIYNQINSTQTGGILAGILKTAIIDAINENVSI